MPHKPPDDGTLAPIEIEAPPLVANVDSLRCTDSLAQSGHVITLSRAELRTSFSKAVPQSWQMYSNNGMLYSSFSSKSLNLDGITTLYATIETKLLL